ncbi:hypothetical protein NXS19_008420 [Fusarium pseudograminearum]|nr:hypothetical protein NXS19_008420 [Fusarium pseudograminearum]
MKSASRLFYLSVFALWAAPGSCESSNDECHISPKSIVGDACASYSTLDKLNLHTKPAIDDLTQNTDFFSHYRVNLFHKKCPFWDDENGMCGNIGCAVETLDNEEDIPEIWRAHALGKLEGPRAKHPGKKPSASTPSDPSVVFWVKTSARAVSLSTMTNATSETTVSLRTKALAQRAIT